MRRAPGGLRGRVGTAERGIAMRLPSPRRHDPMKLMGPLHSGLGERLEIGGAGVPQGLALRDGPILEVDTLRVTAARVSACRRERADPQRQPEPRSRDVVGLAKAAVQALREDVVRQELLNEGIGAGEDVDAAAASHAMMLVEQKDDRQRRLGVSGERDELAMLAGGECVDQGEVALAIGRESAVEFRRHRHPVRLRLSSG